MDSTSNAVKQKATTNAEYKAEAERLSREMDRMFEEMDETRAASKRLQAEMKVIAARTDKRLAELQKLVDSLSGIAQ